MLGKGVSYFFLWLDPKMPVRGKVVINELKWENKLLKLRLRICKKWRV